MGIFALRCYALSLQKKMSFIIIDLCSQSEAVARYVQGWTKEQILHWLSQQGALIPFRVEPGPQLYRFTSHIGMEAIFMLHGNELTFISDHSTWTPHR